jgi:4-hydroxybenzoate polyprenyltransferase
LKVWMSYDMHISLLAIFYVLIADNLFRPFDSLILISSLGFYFMYGFLINDFFDLPFDIAAGKKRAVRELPKSVFVTVILLVVFISALHLLYLKETLYIIAYIVSYLLATLYSAPPIRFKSRGFSGIVVNGLIEKTLPVLAVFSFFNHLGIDTVIFLAASFSMHIVEIVAHQTYDYEADLKSGVRTFVANIGIDKTLRIYNGFIAPSSAVLTISLCLLTCIKVPSATFLVTAGFLSYPVITLSISKGLFKRRKKVFPLYMSCLYILINTALPLFFAFILSLENRLNILIFFVALGSQYYVIKYILYSIREKDLIHFYSLIPG